jgi:hypothetical protein
MKLDFLGQILNEEGHKRSTDPSWSDSIGRYPVLPEIFNENPLEILF